MFNYVGPTWAEKSFDADQNTIPTNFAKEWNLRCVQQIFPSMPPLSIAKRVRTDLPIVWVYSDPWGNVPEIANVSFAEFVSREDWFDIWQECNDVVLKKINDLGVPVLIIGTHCDVINCHYSNITVAHPSMQKWMAEQIDLFKNDKIVVPEEGIVISHCIAHEIYFKFFTENEDVQVDSGLKDLVLDHWIFWRRLEQMNLVYDTHPTRYSYEKFSKLIKPCVEKFISQ
jgi:hypothetical protein